MVFLIQSTQNRDGAAVQAKLDELIRALEPANNQFIGVETRTIKEVHELRQETINEVKKLEELISETETKTISRRVASMMRRYKQKNLLKSSE